MTIDLRIGDFCSINHQSDSLLSYQDRLLKTSVVCPTATIIEKIKPGFLLVIIGLGSVQVFCPSIYYSILSIFFLTFLFLGVGEKGYQTVELRLVGPILSVAGVLLVCCRVILCFVVIL